MTDKNIRILEEEQRFDDGFNEAPPTDIVAYNELRSCADLFRLKDTKQLEIDPYFQRDFVWKKSEQTRFIDSLTKQLPIPSMCISFDYRTDKRMVIDGLQRISSIIKFLSEDDWELSSLSDIDPRLSGKTVSQIKKDNKSIYERVQNVTIPVTVIRCDTSLSKHNEYLFTIFHRLNSAGKQLNNQEIRNCIYSGSFNELLKTLASTKESKKLWGINYRFGSEEMILRFYSFNENLDTYNGKLSKFLNDYMQSKRFIDEIKLLENKSFYNEVVKIVHDKILDKSNKKLSKTVIEGLMYGVAKNISRLRNLSDHNIQLLYHSFESLREYNTDNLKDGLSSKDKVLRRLEASEKCFSM